MNLLILLAICLSLRVATAAPSPPKGFDHHMTVVADEYFLYWTVADDEITFQVQVKTLGYIGFGISPNGAMAGADIVMTWVKDDRVHFQDRHAFRNAMPAIDEEQNWSVVEGKEIDDFTVVTFKRPLISCDKADDMDITGDTIKLIYAYHPEDPKDAASITYHGSKTRGTKSVTLLVYGTQKTVDKVPPNTEYFDFVNPAIEVPAKKTTYWCQAFKMPDLKEKHHAVRFDPIIQEGHEGIAHHIVMYACQHEFDLDSYHGKGEECYMDLMGEVDKCQSITFSWAVGGPALNFPEHMGFPIGADFKPKMIRMEVHYDNPSAKAGIIDSSGIRMYYTKDLREYDAGFLSVGITTRSIIIPPHFETLTTPGHCTNECFSKMIPENEDIKIVSAFLHAHLRSTKIRVRHFRNGKELPLIAKDDNYDFNYQDHRILPKEVSIQPEDSIIVECDYKSAENVTYGGFGTIEEMCIAFLSYYPKKALSRCFSRQAPADMLDFINATIVYDETAKGILKMFSFNVTAPEEYAYKSTKEIINLVDWEDANMRDKFQKALVKERSTIMLICDDGFDGSPRSRYNLQLIKTPKIKETYKAPAVLCSSAFTVRASAFFSFVILQLVFLL